MRSLSFRPPRSLYRFSGGRVDNDVTMSNPSCAPNLPDHPTSLAVDTGLRQLTPVDAALRLRAFWQNEPTVAKTVTTADVLRRWGRQPRPLGFLALCLLALLPFAPAASAQQSAKITGVTVQFEDGSQQKLPPPPAAPQWRRPILGVNLESLKDYERQQMFIDLIKTSRAWGTPDKPYDYAGPVGPDGWPSGDFGTLVLTEQKNVNGVYKFSATGRCDITTPGTGSAKVTNLVYDPATNRTTADIVINASPDKLITLNLAFRGTAGGLKDIKLLRAGYTSDEQIFTSDFLAAITPFDALRFMDLTRTNNSEIVRWDQRVKPTDPQYAGARGAPYEVAIELGNRTNKDIWICVPALADDDFIRQLGALVREKLEPGRACYVEYSNEVWNGQFKQYKQNDAAAKAEVAAGENTLNDGGRDTNVHYWARKRIAKRSVEIKKLMGADDPRIRVVLASQIGYAPPGAMLKQQLEYVAKYHGPPSQFFYAVAGAPYFSPGRDETDPAEKKRFYTQRPDVTVDGICERLLARAEVGGGENVRAFNALARQYGLKSFAYEGGVDLQQFDSNVPIKIASQYDPRTGQAVEDYLAKFYESGGDAMFYFTLTSRYQKNGYWGLTEDARELITPKYVAALRVINRLRERSLPARAPAPAPAPAAQAAPVSAQ